MSFDKYQIIYLHNFKTDCIKKIKIKNEYVDEVEGVLKDLNVGIDVTEVNNYSSKTYLNAFVQSIINENLCYYTNERGRI